jgi:hypothetical protein
VAKVKVHFKIKTNDYLNEYKYRTRTIQMDLITDQQGFICPNETAQKAMDIVREKVIPRMKEAVLSSSLIWTRIVTA